MMPERWEVLKEHLQHGLHFDSSFFFSKAHVENVAPRRVFSNIIVSCAIIKLL